MDGGGKEYDLPSGAKLYVSVAPFAQAKELHDAVASELRGSGIGDLDIVEVAGAISGKSAKGIGALVDKAMGIAASKRVEAAIFACAEKALYRPDGTEASSTQVTRKLFDDPSIRDAARDDYYMICFRVAEVNLRPFVKALSSAFSARAAKSEDTRKSSSETGPTSTTS